MTNAFTFLWPKKIGNEGEVEQEYYEDVITKGDILRRVRDDYEHLIKTELELQADWGKYPQVCTTPSGQVRALANGGAEFEYGSERGKEWAQILREEIESLERLLVTWDHLDAVTARIAQEGGDK